MRELTELGEIGDVLQVNGFALPPLEQRLPPVHPGGVPGGRTARALLVGYMSTASSKLTEGCPVPPPSYGYDRIRFIRGVRLGDTATVEYRVRRSPGARRGTARRPPSGS